MTDSDNECDNSTKFEIKTCVDSALCSLSIIWNKIGIFGESRKSRKTVVLTHVRNLLQEMIREEENLLEKLKNNVESHQVEIETISKELNSTQESVTDSTKTLLQLERQLKFKLDQLVCEKQKRLDDWVSLMTENSKLSAELGTSEVRNHYSVIPSLRDIALLEEHINKLNTEKKRRKDEIVKLRKIILDFLDELELSPTSPFEQVLVNDNDSIMVSATNMAKAEKYKDELMRLRQENEMLANQLWSKIRVIWTLVRVDEEYILRFKEENSGFSQRVLQALSDELNRCEEVKSTNLPLIIESAKEQLVHIWSRCVLLEHKLSNFRPYHQTSVSEELLHVLEKEILETQRYYDDRRHPLEMVAKQQNLWNEFLQLEVQSDNPERFLNRGCNLLKEEKTRRKITVELPRMEQEVVEEIKYWEQQTGLTFTLENGLSFDEYIAKQKQQYIENKENEKTMRHQHRQKQIEDEMHFGSRPITPILKRMNTPTLKSTSNLNTPSNKRCLPDSPQPRKGAQNGSPAQKQKRNDTPVKLAKKLVGKASKILKHSKPYLPAPPTDAFATVSTATGSMTTASSATVSTATCSMTTASLATVSSMTHSLATNSLATVSMATMSDVVVASSVMGRPTSPKGYSDFVTELNSKTNSRSTILSRVVYF